METCFNCTFHGDEEEEEVEVVVEVVENIVSFFSVEEPVAGERERST